MGFCDLDFAFDFLLEGLDLLGVTMSEASPTDWSKLIRNIEKSDEVIWVFDE